MAGQHGSRSKAEKNWIIKIKILIRKIVYVVLYILFIYVAYIDLK